MLRCVECADTTTNGMGWRALLTLGDEGKEAVAVYV